MALTYGFFNSINDDRTYDASDFCNYLKGVVPNGCLAATDLKVLPNPDPIGANPPSVIISPGKAFYDGMWINNDTAFDFNLGTQKQTQSGRYHLVYLCFDTNANARKVTIEWLVSTDSSVTVPGNSNGKYFLPLARITDQQTNQPAAQHIVDIRRVGGVLVHGGASWAYKVYDWVDFSGTGNWQVIDLASPTTIVEHNGWAFQQNGNGFIIPTSGMYLINANVDIMLPTAGSYTVMTRAYMNANGGSQLNQGTKAIVTGHKYSDQSEFSLSISAVEKLTSYEPVGTTLELHIKLPNAIANVGVSAASLSVVMLPEPFAT